MTRRVFKYDVQPVDKFTASVPADAKFLSVQPQGGEVKMWFQVDDIDEPVPVEFYVVGTGHEVPVGAEKFLGTFQMYGGSLVFHLYQGGRVW